MENNKNKDNVDNNLQETVKLTTSAIATTGAKVNTLCYQIDI